MRRSARWLVLLALASCKVDSSCQGARGHVENDVVKGLVREAAQRIGAVLDVDCPELRAELGATVRCMVDFHLGDRPYPYVVAVEPPDRGSKHRFALNATPQVRLMGPAMRAQITDSMRQHGAVEVTCPGLDRVHPVPEAGFVTCTVRGADGSEVQRRLDLTDREVLWRLKPAE